MVNVLDERLFRDVYQGVGGVQGLQQRAGVVLEDVGHLARREARLDEVVALGACRPSLDVYRDIRMRCGVGGHECVRRVPSVLVLTNEHGQRDGTATRTRRSAGLSTG